MLNRKYLLAASLAAALGGALELHWQLILNAVVLRNPTWLIVCADGLVAAAASFILFWLYALILGRKRGAPRAEGTPWPACFAAICAPQFWFTAYHLLPPARLAWVASLGIGLACAPLAGLLLAWLLNKRAAAVALAVAAAAALAFLIVRTAIGDARAQDDRRPNVILVTLDTTRADRLGCYGYAQARTPTLDGLARSGLRFPHAVCLEPLTGPSHATIMTSLYPETTGATLNGLRIRTDIPTLAEQFRAAGYRTSAFLGSTSVQAKYTGLDRGFQIYDDAMTPAEGYSHTPFTPRAVAAALSLFPKDGNDAERPADAVTKSALRWLAVKQEGPYFMWVHYFDPHDDYLPPASYVPTGIGGPFRRKKWNKLWGDGDTSPRISNFIRILYDGEIAFMDAHLGTLLTAVRQDPHPRHTIVLVVADHGEAFNEHGTQYHGYRLYGEEINIPFIVCDLDGALPAARPPAVVSTLDVAPTLLELAGLRIPEGMRGRALFAATAPAETSAYSVCIPDPERKSRFNIGRLNAWTENADKIIMHADGTAEYYNLSSDPEERRDLSAGESKTAGELRSRLEAFRKTVPAAKPAPRDLDAEARRKLRNLGYIR